MIPDYQITFLLNRIISGILNGHWNGLSFGGVIIITLNNLVPIDNIPPLLNVFRTAILILLIIGVFPDIQLGLIKMDIIGHV